MPSWEKETKPWRRSSYTVASAADYLGISMQEVLDRMPYHTHRGVRVVDDLFLAQAVPNFSWQAIGHLRNKIDREASEARERPHQLDIFGEDDPAHYSKPLKSRSIKPKALDKKTFNIPAAATFLNITEQHLLFLLKRRGGSYVYQESDREFVYKNTLFTWEEVILLRKKLNKVDRKTKKPQQLRFNEPL